MAEHRAKQRYDWSFVCSAPPREVFAVTEQLIGTPPYQFELTDDHAASAVERLRKGFFGNWTKRVRRPNWIDVSAQSFEAGTKVSVASSGSRPAKSRALQVIYLLQRGAADQHTVYRTRHIPRGPVTLVASWAGTGYPLYVDASFDAARSGPVVRTATEIVAVEERGHFVQVRLADGRTGWVERDQIVGAPAEATRDAQDRSARDS